MALIAHVNSRRVSEADVMAVPEPPFTETWHPVAHARVLKALEEAASRIELGIKDRAYSMSKNGELMFGSWQLELDADEERAYEIGIRNSINKRFAIGLTAGTRVFVCDNLAFTGEFIDFRKHTNGVDDAELERLAEGAFEKAVPQLKLFDEWHRSLKTVNLEEDMAKLLTFDAMERGIVSPSRFKEFLECMKTERETHGDTLYAWHGAVTRLMRADSLFAVAETSKALNKIIAEYLELYEGIESAYH